MTEIDAYFYQNHIIVKRGKEYKTGEVLLAYLSRDFDDLTAMLNQCKHYAVNLHYPETRSEIRVVNQLFRQAHNFFSILYQLIGSLPPYDSMPPCKDVFAEMLDYFGTDADGIFFAEQAGRKKNTPAKKSPRRHRVHKEYISSVYNHIRIPVMKGKRSNEKTLY